MTTPDEDLTTTEGVDEGSALSTAEDAGTPGPRGPAASGSLRSPAKDESDPAPPQDVSSPDSARARELGTGQQLEAGEG